MPTYQYACTACNERLEAVQRFTDDPLTDCSSCGGRLRKVYSAVGVVFKGSGFYRTDSRASANGSSAAAESKSEPAKSDTAKAEPAKSESGKAESGSSSTASDSAAASKSAAPAAATP